jgi:hypothetical protein
MLRVGTWEDLAPILLLTSVTHIGQPDGQGMQAPEKTEKSKQPET